MTLQIHSSEFYNDNNIKEHIAIIIWRTCQGNILRKTQIEY
jgi:hypothetical protein